MSSILTLAGNNTSSGFYPHSIDQSLRFEDGDSPYLSRTPSSAGNRDVNTTSFWIKRGNLGFKQMIFTAGSSFPNNHDNSTAIQFLADDTFRFLSESGGSIVARLDTTRVLRDVSSWYHIVLTYESTNSTSADRIKLYINGVRETAFAATTYPSSGVDNFFASDNVHQIGRSTTNYADCYLAEFNFIDGTALGPDSFGETKDGIWVPKDVSGLTYGTNGFHLDFADSSAIGNDVSGQNNDFAVSGLVASDVVLDSVTNNFNVINALDPLVSSSGVTLSEGNLRVQGGTGGNFNVVPTFDKVVGSYYSEFYVEATGNNTQSAIFVRTLVGGVAFNYQLKADGDLRKDGTTVATLSAFSAGDIIGASGSTDDNTVKFFVNGSSVYTDTHTSNFEKLSIVPRLDNTTTPIFICNYGQDSTFAGNTSAGGNSDSAGIGDFKYAVPSGAKAICSANLPEPSIIDGSEYFNTVLYNGTSAENAITVGFQPDWCWLKDRDNSTNHVSYDSVRGATKTLRNDDPAAETTDAQKLKSFDSDGFTLGTDNNPNGSARGPFVAWNWKAGTSVSGNTTGSGTAKAYSGSVNTDAGFSIITYKGNGTAGHTIPHNLGAKPSMVLFKNRDEDDQWAVYHKDILATHNLCLNNTDGNADQDNRFNDTEPTDSVMTLGTGHVVNATDEDYIAYFFTDIDQYCKAGSYTGLNASDNTYVHLGFRPAWVMCKSYTQGGSGYDWVIYDNKRSPTNPVGFNLEANNNIDDESVRGVPIDFLSNGFKIRNSYAEVGSNKGYIYLAFAEQPAKFSNAR